MRLKYLLTVINVALWDYMSHWLEDTKTGYRGSVAHLSCGAAVPAGRLCTPSSCRRQTAALKRTSGRLLSILSIVIADSSKFKYQYDRESKSHAFPLSGKSIFAVHPTNAGSPHGIRLPPSCKDGTCSLLDGEASWKSDLTQRRARIRRDCERAKY
jgi:hypothetical protein